MVRLTSVSFTSSLAFKATEAELVEKGVKNLSLVIVVKLFFVVFDCELKNPMPDIEFSALSFFEFCRMRFGSISEATIESTSSETLKPEPLLLTSSDNQVY